MFQSIHCLLFTNSKELTYVIFKPVKFYKINLELYKKKKKRIRNFASTDGELNGIRKHFEMFITYFLLSKHNKQKFINV